MAQTLTDIGTPKRFTLTPADQALAVTLPRGTRKVTLQFITNAGKYGNDGSDGVALTDFTTIVTNTLIEKQVNEVEHGIPAIIFVESAVDNTVVEITPEAV